MSGRRRAAGPLLVIVLSSIALAILDASGQAFWQGLVDQPRDLHHPDRQPEPDQRVHRRVLARPDRVHGPGRLRLGDPDPAAPGEGVVPAGPAVVARRRPPRPGRRPDPGRVPRRDADRRRPRQRDRLAGRPGADAAVGPLRRGRDARLPRDRPGLLFNADAFTRGSRTFSNVTPVHEPVVDRRAGRCSWSTSCGGSSARSYGRDMFAQREDRVAAQAIGIRVMDPRLLAFVVGAFFSAVAGLAVRPLHHVVLADGLLLRPDVPGHHDAGHRRDGLGQRLDPRRDPDRRPGRGPAARRGRDAALRAVRDRPRRDLHRRHHRPPRRAPRPARGPARPAVRPGAAGVAGARVRRPAAAPDPVADQSP